MKPKNEQCMDCAFKEGGAANKEAYNRLRGEVCALGAIPFFCHHSIDWQSQHSWTSEEKRQACRTSGACGGWVARVNVLRAKGFYDQYRVIRQAVAKQALFGIDLLCDATDKKRKKVLSTLRRMMRFLAAQDIERKKIPLFWG